MVFYAAAAVFRQLLSAQGSINTKVQIFSTVISESLPQVLKIFALLLAKFQVVGHPIAIGFEM
jgi:hypothetical protein